MGLLSSYADSGGAAGLLGLPNPASVLPQYDPSVAAILASLAQAPQGAPQAASPAAVPPAPSTPQPPPAASGAPDGGQSAAPPGPAFPTQMLPPLRGFANTIDKLFTGGAAEASREKQNAYMANQIAVQNMRTRAAQIAQTEGPDMAQMFVTQPDLYAKLHEPHDIANGASAVVNGNVVRPPLLGFDANSGKGYAVGATGSTASPSPSLGGDYSNTGGVISSARTGEIAHVVTPPTDFAASNTFVPAQVDGAPVGSAPAFGSPVGAPQLGAPTVSGPNAPRGIRNNNYTNLTALPNGQQWDGQTGVDSGGYVQFATPQAGLAAADKNLQAYGARHGINTVSGMIGRWAPASAGNNTAAYSNFVAGKMGVGPNDTIDLTNPATRQAALGAIAAYENGPKAFSGTPAAPMNPPRIGQPSPTASSALPPGSVTGKAAAPMSPQEVRSLGLAPGRYQREVNGTITPISAAPKDDMDRIASLNATTQGLRALSQEQQMFMRNNEQAGTGAANLPIEAFGHNINPLEAIGKQRNSAFNSMVASEGKQLFMVKPANAGARILQSELPYWAGQTQAVDLPPSANLERLRTTNANLAKAQAQSNFYQDWIYKNGNLDGADAAWDRQQNGQTVAAPTSIPTLTPEQVAKIPKGTGMHFMTTDGRQMVR